MILKRSSLIKNLRIGFTRLSLDQILHAISFYAIPAAILLVTLVALFLWDDVYSARPEAQLELQVLEPSDNTTTLSDAKEKLSKASGVAHFNTRLSEQPVWFGFSTPNTIGSKPLIEFPSRHAVSIACWDSDSLLLLGDSLNMNSDSQVTRVKTGYALKLAKPGSKILCKASFKGPARLSAESWEAGQSDLSEQDHHRKSGLIDGGLIVLALFVLITAIITREGLYVLFAAWLMVTVRISATAGGWDSQWLNHAVPSEWILDGRSLMRAAWGVLTITIFKTLFRDDIEKTRYTLPVTIVQWLCLALFAAAFVLPRNVFLPTLWLIGGIALPILTYSIVGIVYRTHSRVALLYAASLVTMLLSTQLDIISVAFSTKGIVNSASGVVFYLASGLLASLAIAERMREEHNQRLEVQAELQHTYESMPIGLFTLNLQGQFTSANPALHDMLGRNILNEGQNAWPQYFSDGAWFTFLQRLQNHQDVDLEVDGVGVGADGEVGPRRYLIKAILARDKVEGSLQDVTDKSRATKELGFLAHHDSLTKVLNRRGIEQEFEKARVKLEAGQPMAMAYLDLDRFKLINDLFGHPAGDVVLQRVCERVGLMLSAGIQIGRVGGDEFVIVFPDTKLPMAAAICRGIVDSIGGAPYRVGEKAFHVRGSIGLIEIRPGTNLKDAMATADRACSKAKKGQAKGLVVYEKDAPAFLEHEAEIHLVEHLSAGENIEGLFLVMQPIMSLRRPYESLNFEVLLRMKDRDGNLVPVSRLIAAGEHSGRMSVIDRWVLTTTLAWLNRHHTQLKNMKFVCMNLSGASLNDEEFMLEVFRLLEQNSQVVHYLSLEVTESVALHDLKNTRRFIDKVRGYGAKVALDDFGAGYTSFSYLKELPADLLKIDGSFIVDMNKHPANIAIVEAIVSLSRNLGMKTIAEWAEDNATVRTLAEIGVDYVQGYAVARPQPCDNMLTAESSASFITDEALIQMCRLMGTAKDPFAKKNALFQEDVNSLH